MRPRAEEEKEKLQRKKGVGKIVLPRALVPLQRVEADCNLANTLDKTLMLGKIEGRRRRGRHPGPLLRRSRSPDPSSKATLWVKAQHEGALPPPCIVRKDPRNPRKTSSVLLQCLWRP